MSRIWSGSVPNNGTGSGSTVLSLKYFPVAVACWACIFSALVLWMLQEDWEF